MSKLDFAAIEKDRAQFGRKKGKTDEVMDTFAKGKLSPVGEAKAWLIDLSEIEPRKTNEFHKTNIDSLKDSIRIVGIIHPIALLDNGEDYKEGKRYTIISGHRRFEALSALHEEEPLNPKFSKVPAQIYTGIPEDIETQLYVDANLESRNISFEDALLHIDYILNNIERNPRFAESLKEKELQERGVVKRNDYRINKAAAISRILTKELGFPGFSNITVWRILKIKEYERNYNIKDEDSILKQIAKNETTVKEAFYTYYPSVKATKKHKFITMHGIKKQLDSLYDSLNEGNYKNIDDAKLSEVLMSIENLQAKILEIKQKH